MSDEITPFRVELEPGEVEDLRDRLHRTRWPERETVDDWSQGLPLAVAQDLCGYWADGYDFAAAQERLNRFPQFRTDIDGLGIHFLHVRSPHDDATPLVLTHGWPGSFVEFSKVIAPLADPEAHGGDAADAFHVVCPTLPGFGYSDKPTERGWNAERIATAWATLMARLGYDRYVANGGDWGAAVTTNLGLQDVAHVAGIHINMPVAFPDETDLLDLTEQEQATLAHWAEFNATGSGYAVEQSTRPQTMGYGLVDSPTALCTWIIEKYYAWTDSDGRVEDVITRDELLDNLMLYWMPGAGASSARLYWESFNSPSTDPVTVPAGFSISPKETWRSSRRWAEKRYTDLRYWNELDAGGHFAAFEQPDSFVEELRTFFRLVR